LIILKQFSDNCNIIGNLNDDIGNFQ